MSIRFQVRNRRVGGVATACAVLAFLVIYLGVPQAAGAAVVDNRSSAQGCVGQLCYGVGPTPNSVASNASVVGVAVDPATSGSGYWEVASDGGVFAFNAPFYGSMGGQSLAAPMAGMAATPSGGGYWEVGADGGVFAFGNAGFYGSIHGSGGSGGPQTVAIVSSPDGGGYWEIDADGGVFAYGDAPFYGSLPGLGVSTLEVVSATNWGNGYAILLADGTVYTFTSSGSGSTAPGGSFNIYTDPAVAIGAANWPGAANGFWMVDREGHTYTYGTAQYEGSVNSAVGIPWGPIDGVSGYGTAGYDVVGADGGTFSFNLPFEGNASVSSELGSSYAQQIGFLMLPQGDWGEVFTSGETYSCPNPNGESGQWCDGLLPLWNQESGWQWNAQNPSSGAYGIPQALPASRMCDTGGGVPPCPPPQSGYTYAWQNNAWTQIMWGFWYIGTPTSVCDNQGYCGGGYGDPEAAWAHEQQFGWYVAKP